MRLDIFLEVDVDYPSYLHDAHNDLPFLCERKKPPNSNSEKLLCTLNSKIRYVTHYLTLKQALEHGLVLKKIHRGIKFFQSNWISPYVELNSQFRKNSTNEFHKNFFKLMVNSVFGKLMEGVRKRIDCRLISKWDHARRAIAKPTFKDFTIFDENLVLVNFMKNKVKFNKSIFAGASILDQSKLKMYNFHYDIIIPKLGSDNVKLLYIDTDSFFNEQDRCVEEEDDGKLQKSPPQFLPTMMQK